MASPWALAGARSGAPKPTVNTVRGEAAGDRRLGPGDMPSSLVGEGGSEDERVGEDERADEAGQGATLLCMGPWNRKEHPPHSGSDSEAMSSYCPRRMGGSFVDCWAKGYLEGEGGRKRERG